MPIVPGTKLGPYEVLSAAGAGGMGEVYKARDTRLERTVAIKVLPSHLSANPDLRARFEREAKSISGLQHPNICVLYDVGSQDGVDFLVMEYLEGETLATRLEKGAMPLAELLKAGVQIADALDKAHRGGIVHRDLKPGNVMLTKSGAKLMDFGLAKPHAFAGSQSGAPAFSAAMTMTSPASPITLAGTVVGTVQFMSPEQIQGKDADARSDIFAFGAVLYEMATGKRAFEGKSQLSVASAILEKEPEPISTIQPLTPPALEQVVQSCLAKDPEERFQSAHDLKVQLGWLASAGSSAFAPAIQARKHSWMPLAGLTGLALLVAVFVWTSFFQTRASAKHVVRSTMLAPAQMHFLLQGRNGPPAISPDGARIAFVAGSENKSSIWVRSLDSMDATEVTGTDGGYYPFWAPDSHHMGFYANGKLWKIDTNGGPATMLCNAAMGRGGSWYDDVILFTPTIQESIYQVSANGGKPSDVTHRTDISGSHRWPQFMPDGRHFIFLYTPTGAANENSELHFASLDGKEDKTVVHTSYNAVYASGKLLYVKDGSLLSQTFDPSTGQISSEAVPIAEQVEFSDTYSTTLFSASPSGLLLYRKGKAGIGELLQWFDRKGKRLDTVEIGIQGGLRLSPDGKQLVLESFPATGSGNSGANHIALIDLKRGSRSKFSFKGSTNTSPIWSRDGRTIYFSSNADAPRLQIYRKPADGSGPEQILLQTKNDASPEDVSPEGGYLVYTIQTDQKKIEIWVLPLKGEAKPFALLQDAPSQMNARFSPDGRWIAYQSNEMGKNEVYVTSFPKPSGKFQISISGGAQPVWSHDGKELYYLDNAQNLMAVAVRFTATGLEASVPVQLFQTNLRTSIEHSGYDISADRRFIVNIPTEESSIPLTLVQNWATALKK